MWASASPLTGWLWPAGSALRRPCELPGMGEVLLKGHREAHSHPTLLSCRLSFTVASEGHFPFFGKHRLTLVRSKALLLARRKCWVFYAWPSFLSPPNLSKNLVFSQSTHISCPQEKEFFSSQGYIFTGRVLSLECKHRPSWCYVWLVEKLLYYFGETWGRKSLFWCRRFFFLIGSR